MDSDPPTRRVSPWTPWTTGISRQGTTHVSLPKLIPLDSVPSLGLPFETQKTSPSLVCAHQGLLWRDGLMPLNAVWCQHTARFTIIKFYLPILSPGSEKALNKWMTTHKKWQRIEYRFEKQKCTPNHPLTHRYRHTFWIFFIYMYTFVPLSKATYNNYWLAERETAIHCCRYSKDAQRFKCQALEIAR